MRAALALCLLALATPACDEMPQRVIVDEGKPGLLPQGAADPMRERALAQNESSRIYP